MVGWRRSEIGPTTAPAMFPGAPKYTGTALRLTEISWTINHGPPGETSELQDEINSTGGFGALNLILTFDVHSDNSAISKTHPSMPRFLDVEIPFPIRNTIVSTLRRSMG
jgi:hypothetical protein